MISAYFIGSNRSSNKSYRIIGKPADCNLYRIMGKADDSNLLEVDEEFKELIALAILDGCLCTLEKYCFSKVIKNIAIMYSLQSTLVILAKSIRQDFLSGSYK